MKIKIIAFVWAAAFIIGLFMIYTARDMILLF